MMTVKVIDVQGNESVFQARHVVYDVQRTPRACVECFDDRHEPIHVAGLPEISAGKVYVMNDAGKTVADYNLGGWQRETEPPADSPAKR